MQKLRINRRFIVNVNTANLQDSANILVKTFPRKAIRRNAVAHHAAQRFARFEHAYAMPHQRCKISAGHPTRTSTNDGNFSPGFNIARGRRHRIATRIIARVLFDATNIKRRIDQPPSAANFARMLADQRTCCRERIVFANHVYRSGVIALRHQRNIRWNVNMSRTKCLTRNFLLDSRLASVLLNVRGELRFVRLKTLQKHVGCVIPNSAIGRFTNKLRQIARLIKRFGAGSTRNNIVQQGC